MVAEALGIKLDVDDLNESLHVDPEHPTAWAFGPTNLITQTEGEDQQKCEALVISTFETKSFVADPEKYLKDRLGDERAEKQIKNSNLGAVVEDAKAFHDNPDVTQENRKPGLEDIRKLLAEDWYLVLLVDLRGLNPGRDAELDQKLGEGPISHYLFVYDFNDDGIMGHDPGPPEAHKERFIPWNDLGEIWKPPVIRAFRSKSPSIPKPQTSLIPDPPPAGAK